MASSLSHGLVGEDVGNETEAVEDMGGEENDGEEGNHREETDDRQHNYQYSEGSSDNSSTDAVTPVAAGCFGIMAVFSGESDSDSDLSENDQNEYLTTHTLERNALAASNALVGESLLDSPQPRSMKRDLRSHPSARVRQDVPLRQVPPPPPNHLQVSSVGILAHGLAWVQRTKDARRRQYLQHLAEQQCRKLQEAQQLMEDPSSTSQTQYSTSLSQNSTFRSILSLPSHEPTPSTSMLSVSGTGYSLHLGGPHAHDPAAPTHADPSHGNDQDDDYIPPVRIEDEPDLQGQPFLLTPSERQQVARLVLPKNIAYCRWRRLYSLVRDGDSLETCLRLVQDHPRTLLVLRTTRNQVLGGFADAPWRVDSGGPCYYGGPDACLFKVEEKAGTEGGGATRTETCATDPLSATNHNDTTVKAFHWTGTNRYIQLCDHARKMLAFGGGGQEGAFGLSVEQDFMLGSTGHCATFDNEPLCDQDTFEIVDLEIYGFLVGQF